MLHLTPPILNSTSTSQTEYVAKMTLFNMLTPIMPPASAALHSFKPRLPLQFPFPCPSRCASHSKCSRANMNSPSLKTPWPTLCWRHCLQHDGTIAHITQASSSCLPLPLLQRHCCPCCNDVKIDPDRHWKWAWAPPTREKGNVNAIRQCCSFAALALVNYSFSRKVSRLGVTALSLFHFSGARANKQLAADAHHKLQLGMSTNVCPCAL